MFPSSERSKGRPFVLAIALVLGGLSCLLLSWASWASNIEGKRTRGVAEFFFARQDMWVLDVQALALTLGGLCFGGWVTRHRTASGIGTRLGAGSGGPYRQQSPGMAWLLAFAIILAVLASWFGRTWIFHGHSLSRDELMVEMAASAIAQGHIGWPIPPEWLSFRRAMLPEFYSPYGADTHWTPIYLPVHAAIRALFLRIGNADLASPVMLGIGLSALWYIARTLLPGRRDAVIVAMVMALTSAQLLVTAATPYAMTSHFALNMLWLALVIRGGWLAHGLAGLVALLAAGLHQWHFPLLFIGPFILWMAANRRWGAALFHVMVALAIMVVWARLWPMVLSDLVGPAPLSDVHRTNGILDKLESLFGRLESLQPLLNNARLVAWNNLLLLPLAALALLGVHWRGLLRDVPITVPLFLGVLAGMGLALFQGYGWGFRYMHGQIGALCLLAGLGWRAVVPGGARSGKILIVGSAAFALASGAWLAQDTESYVRGNARTMASMRATDADVVLVDIRGGYFMTDMVRFGEEGRPGRPAMMALHMLSRAQLNDLCAKYNVAIMDRTQFWPLGVHPVSPHFRGSENIQKRRDHLAEIGCGRPVIATPADPQ